MPRVTKAQLDRRAALLDEMGELKRRADTLGAEVKEITEAAEADLKASGRPMVRRGGYRVEWIKGRASIAWKSELVSRLGSDVASEIQKSAPPTQKLSIVAPAESPSPA